MMDCDRIMVRYGTSGWPVFSGNMKIGIRIKYNPRMWCVSKNMKWRHTPGSRVAVMSPKATVWTPPPTSLWSKEKLETDRETLPPQKICLGLAAKKIQHTHIVTVYIHTLHHVSKILVVVLFTGACPVFNKIYYFMYWLSTSYCTGFIMHLHLSVLWFIVSQQEVWKPICVGCNLWNKLSVN